MVSYLFDYENYFVIKEIYKARLKLKRLILIHFNNKSSNILQDKVILHFTSLSITVQFIFVHKWNYF